MARARRGFTLVEILIALAIMAVIATLGYRALATLTDSEVRLSAEAARWRTLDAALARIELTEAEIDRLAGELDVIASAVARVSEVATPDVPATSHPVPMSNVMRDDVPVTPLPVADVLAAAPDARDGQFGVPQILEEDA